MKIRITGAKKNTYWYAGKIGEVFEVTGGSTGYSGGVLVLHDGSRDRFVVQLEDYEIITEDSTPITVLPDESLGGIKREYREVKRKANVGERIIFDGNSWGITANRPYAVVGGDHDGAEFVDDDGDTRWEAHIQNATSYVVLEPTDVVYVDDADGASRKYRMVDRKATKGERVIVVNIRYQHDKTETLSVGQIGVCTCDDEFADGSIDTTLTHDDCGFLNADRVEYRVLEPIKSEEETAPAPLSTCPATEQAAENIASLTAKVQTLESRVHSLESRVAALEAAAKPRKQRAPITADVFPKSPQQIRDEIVERAKADVKELSDRDGYVKLPNSFGSNFVCVTEFIVNRNKRKVTVVLRGYTSRKVRAVGWAKCAPNDVFNVWIGKAIALRRALGLEVPVEYLSVPQPTKIRVGDIVKYRDGARIAIVGANDDQTLNIDTHTYLSTAVGHEATIIDDSREEADDSVSSTKGAAA